MIPAAFPAYILEEKDGRVCASFTDLSAAQLDPGEVVIRVAWSGVNYKDALAATGKGKIIRRFPCVGGIDLSGEVVESADPRFRRGDRVLATGYGIGVSHHGGYAHYARLPAAWVIPLPAGLCLREAMVLGTAGFTAALAVTRMEENGLCPGQGPVVVSGATGGVGSLAVAMLAKLGHEVTALTGKAQEADFLKGLGASDVLLRQSIDFAKVRPLDKAQWAGGVDSLGGETLAWMLATARPCASVASIGLAASADLKTSVMPFILRGVNLLGIDSVTVGEPRRSRVWERLATDLALSEKVLGSLAREVEFKDLPGVFDAFIAGKAKGRTVVKIGHENTPIL